MNPPNKPFVPWYEKYRVRLSFVYAALFLIYARPGSLIFLAPGLMLAAFGIFLRQWAAGHIKKMNEVSQSGPYAMARHPLYVGSFIGALGCLIASLPYKNSSPFYSIQTLFIWILFFLLIRNIYIPKAKKEEENLTLKFGQAYTAYAGQTPRFFPKNWENLKNFRETFQWDLWLRNQEFMSMIGLIFIAFLLISRYIHGN